MSIFRNVSLLIRKIFLNLQIDLKWLLLAPISPQQRIVFWVRKYISIFTDSRRIYFLNGWFHYDNRLTPALLSEYVFEIADLRKFLGSSEVKNVLDIGANIGQFAYTVRALHPNLEVYSFEPNPEIFSLIKKNCEQDEKWKCYNFGIGESNVRMPLFFVDGKSGQGSIYRENSVLGLLSNQIKQVDVEIRKLDDQLRSEIGIPKKFDFVKIDVEGAERQVLKTLGGITWKYLYIELSAGRKGDLSHSEAIEILQANGAFKIETLVRTLPAGPSQTFQVLFYCGRTD